MKKLNTYEMNLIKEIIEDNDSLIIMDNKQYFLTLVEEPIATIKEEVVPCQDVARRLNKAKRRILKGKDFSIDDVVEMMELGML